jgi:hypothetical protein
MEPQPTRGDAAPPAPKIKVPAVDTPEGGSLPQAVEVKVPEAPVAMTPQTNLVENPGMEEGPLPKPLTQYGKDSHSGKFCARLVPMKGRPTTGTQFDQRFELEGKDCITASLWLKVPQLDAGMFRLRVLFRNAAGEPVSSGLLGNVRKPVTKWRAYEASIPKADWPVDAVTASFYCGWAEDQGKKPEGVAFLDDLRFLQDSLLCQ